MASCYRSGANRWRVMFQKEKLPTLGSRNKEKEESLIFVLAN